MFLPDMTTIVSLILWEGWRIPVSLLGWMSWAKVWDGGEGNIYSTPTVWSDLRSPSHKTFINNLSSLPPCPWDAVWSLSGWGPGWYLFDIDLLCLHRMGLMALFVGRHFPTLQPTACWCFSPISTFLLAPLQIHLFSNLSQSSMSFYKLVRTMEFLYVDCW